ncbi:tetratricopeptide repeat protein [Polyangium aurulentum]|uniref:tetratricopeptide repeat protein n=1 Tax=Polyangium aurulentum TaxID=2567896 RepID=UPI0010AE4EC0|nr:tetratricopeptide repeat protein [Polyangium aurulentum]UQA61375.1 tetratricopeptide repeat protein [Polyangium aurulentum]
MRSSARKYFVQSLTVTLLLTALLGASPAHVEPTEQDKNTARTLLLAGRDLLKAGKPRAALEAFERAHAIMHVPTTGLDVAKAQEALGSLIEARKTASEVIGIPAQANEPPAFTDARKAAAEMIERLDNRIPSLRLRVQGAPASVIKATVDGEQIPASELSTPRKLNPGSHEVVVKAPERMTVRQEVKLQDGATAPVEVAVTLVPVDDSSTSTEPGGRSKALIYAGIGVSGALAAVGVGTAIGAAVTDKAAYDEWDESGCTSQVLSCRENFNEKDQLRVGLGSAAIWSFVGAVAVGGATAVYALTGKKTASKPQAAVFVAPQGGAIVVTGNF